MRLMTFRLPIAMAVVLGLAAPIAIAQQTTPSGATPAPSQIQPNSGMGQIMDRGMDVGHSTMGQGMGQMPMPQGKSGAEMGHGQGSNMPMPLAQETQPKQN